MDSNVKLGRILGVPIGLHWSWFLIFVTVTWSLSQGVFASQYPGLSQITYWSLGTMTSSLLFASVLAHEFGHAVVSIRNNIPVTRITLFVFGGLAQIAEEPKSPWVEFRIAIAGPLVSMALALLFGGFYLLSRSVPILAGVGQWLAEVNFTLALFNMLPGFPLDGGRVLRSILWAVSKSYQKATRWATVTGQVIALGFAVLGVGIISRGNFSNGIWLMFIGWFLNNAAISHREQMETDQILDNVRVTQVMDRRLAEIPASLTLCELVGEKIVQDGQRSFLVSENHQPIGLVTIRDIISIPRLEWSRTNVSQIMIPWDRLVQVSPHAAVANVLHTMELANLSNIPVVENNQVEGLLTRDHILHYLRARNDL